MEKYKIKDIQRMLGVSRSAVLEMIERREIGHIKIGKRTYVLKSQYDEFLTQAIVPRATAREGACA